MPVAPPPCVPAALVCIAPEYAAVVSYDYALRIGTLPPRAIDEAVSTRLGARISLFTGDVVLPVPQDDTHKVCGKEGCVVVGSFDESPASLRVTWGAVSSRSGEASVSDSISIAASDPTTKAAAIKAVFLPTDKSGRLLPLSRVVEKKSGQ